jgi:hypothetical protein
MGKPRSSLRDVKAPIQGRHAPGKVGAAGIGAGVAVIGRGTLEATVIVRPFPGTDSSFTSAGDTGGGGWKNFIGSGGATSWRASSWPAVMIRAGAVSPIFLL